MERYGVVLFGEVSYNFDAVNVDADICYLKGTHITGQDKEERIRGGLKHSWDAAK
jgi:hypothetical protein